MANGASPSNLFIFTWTVVPLLTILVLVVTLVLSNEYAADQNVVVVYVVGTLVVGYLLCGCLALIYFKTSWIWKKKTAADLPRTQPSFSSNLPTITIENFNGSSIQLANDFRMVQIRL